jgi:hypothetical protein
MVPKDQGMTYDRDVLTFCIETIIPDCSFTFQVIYQNIMSEYLS